MNLNDSKRTDNPFVCQIVGYKNSGKTALVCSLVERLTALGYKVAVIKHDAHDFEMDHPGTDSYRHRAAGAAAIALVSPRKTAVIRDEETSLNQLIGGFSAYDIILVEGFKREGYPKLVMVRRPKDRELIGSLEAVAGVVSWLPMEETFSDVEQGFSACFDFFDKDEHKPIVEWILRQAAFI
ncbi:molybdopterin-guanine dinucleotide biosynthesis protein B [Paenibacillus sp.]|jgi:molybdopterin-guanine dinucleotide biosynthesis protein B|uniref:molybdopterin-guanine dinucleotide biosynthesis protein B n=1 Tax=Paenibacillus sp. TaxID=58172 RepID=UPI00282D03B1|nr:molybdopterin-guanine dinucleotide biosynthesis protein B [Paenibacillus sp.]MDR0267583.1 molybdopterin-guanine dinucleotide biosynthesis protein B [Paenibacillus sp.]